MSEWLILGIVGFLSGVCASLGIGGGFVLLLYLTAVASLPQREAQLLNLIFFLPIAVLSLVIHVKNKLIDFPVILPAVLGGVAGVLLGVQFASALTDEWLAKLFAVFIFGIGCRELFSRPKPKPLPPADRRDEKQP